MERIRIATIACMCERLQRVNRWTWEPARRRGEKKEGNAFKRTGDQSAAAPATSIEEIGSSERGAKRVCGERGSSHFYDHPPARPRPPSAFAPRSIRSSLNAAAAAIANSAGADARTDAVNKE